MTELDLRLGRYQDVLYDVRCDAVIVDAPYSARTHGGHDGAPTVGGYRGGIGDASYETAPGLINAKDYERRAINYAGWTDDDVDECVDFFAPRCSGWFVTITDHVLAPRWSAALASHDRYVFAPLPWVAPGSRVRLTGDGPSSWTCWIIVARPRTPEYVRWGTLPGAYITGVGGLAERKSRVVGGKPVELMRALVRDYSRPGDLVCDPCSGGGTTGIACAWEGRRFVGAEMDADTHAMALERMTGVRGPAEQGVLL